MKNLDALNPSIAQPRTFSSTIAFLPFLLGLVCLPLAFAAAPTLPFERNILALVCAAQSLTSVILMIVPRFFHWDWQSKYFGVTLLCVGSTSVIGVIPWLGIVIFSDLSISFRFVLLLAYTVAVTWWCRRFVKHYRQIFNDPTMRNEVYKEDEDAIYYMQQGDKLLFEKRLKLEQFPPNTLSILFLLLAFLTVPFATALSDSVGASYINIFLSIAGVPIVLMSLGLGVRGYLIFYHYPWRLKRSTGKDVYVLMAKETSLRAPK